MSGDPTPQEKKFVVTLAITTLIAMIGFAVWGLM